MTFSKNNINVLSHVERNYFMSFKHDVSHVSLPHTFTYPFAYEVHPIAHLAALQLQNYLDTQTEWKHNFGLHTNDVGMVIGKMFGVLVVKSKNGNLGFLAACSGKLANSNEHSYFVPPIFDMLQEDGWYKTGEKKLNALNHTIENLEKNEQILQLRKKICDLENKAQEVIGVKKDEYIKAKQRRKQQKLYAMKHLSVKEIEAILTENRNESLRQQYFIRQAQAEWEQQIKEERVMLLVLEQQIEALKEQRKAYSYTLQQELFENYQFLNAKKEWKSLKCIFNEELNIAPPAGAGECAAPKLLHYAYMHDMEPVALSEFWWGQSPKSEVRKHKEYYPACSGKCGPILGHMLKGLLVDDNPMMKNPAHNKELEIIYEDDAIIVVNKPAEFLSVPGKFVTDSVQQRIQEKYPNAVLVHRLDQSTSGILLIAKTKTIHYHLQKQFIKRTVTKRYVALLEGIIPTKEGYIDLPLRVDLENRPYQLVCYDYGKPAQTRYEVIGYENDRTKVYFYPLTGRTHQLRVHASHSLGLNTPIVGDDLYGNRAERLCLHAEMLTFLHPLSGNEMTFEIPADFL